MAWSVVVSLVWVILAISVWVILINNLILIFGELWFWSLLSSWFDSISQLFWTVPWYIFASLIICVLLILLFRFFISWIGEDSGSSANS